MKAPKKPIKIIKAPKKDSKLADPQKQLHELKVKLREVHQQLRAGATTNVRQPAQLRKQIAQVLTKIKQLKLDQESPRG